MPEWADDRNDLYVISPFYFCSLNIYWFHTFSSTIRFIITSPRSRTYTSNFRIVNLTASGNARNIVTNTIPTLSIENESPIAQGTFMTVPPLIIAPPNTAIPPRPPSAPVVPAVTTITAPPLGGNARGARHLANQAGRN